MVDRLLAAWRRSLCAVLFERFGVEEFDDLRIEAGAEHCPQCRSHENFIRSRHLCQEFVPARDARFMIKLGISPIRRDIICHLPPTKLFPSTPKPAQETCLYGYG